MLPYINTWLPGDCLRQVLVLLFSNAHADTQVLSCFLHPHHPNQSTHRCSAVGSLHVSPEWCSPFSLSDAWEKENLRTLNTSGKRERKRSDVSSFNKDTDITELRSHTWGLISPNYCLKAPYLLIQSLQSRWVWALTYELGLVHTVHLRPQINPSTACQRILLRKVNFNHLYSMSFTSHHSLFNSSMFIFLSREPKLFWGCHWVFPGECEMGTTAIPAHWRQTLEEFCDRGRFVQVTVQVHQECHQHAPRKILPG